MMPLRAKLAELGRQLKAQVAYYRALYCDPRTPLVARVLLWCAVAYALLPFDLIPDFIPVIGHLDDLVIIPAIVILALRMVPVEVKVEHRVRLGLS